MIKLFARAAIVGCLLVTAIAPLRAHNDDYLLNFGCGPAPAIDDPQLLADLESKTDFIKATAVQEHGRSKEWYWKLYNAYPRDVRHLAEEKLSHMICVLLKNPDSTLRESERIALKEFGPDPTPETDRTADKEATVLPVTCASTCSTPTRPGTCGPHDPAVQLKPLLTN